ncbi:MAG: flagellar motor protein MotB [Nitrospiria bacterium]
MNREEKWNRSESAWHAEAGSVSEGMANPSDLLDAQNDAARSWDLEQWSVPWSDLMMTMFVLFAVLLSTQFYEKEVVKAYRSDPGAEGTQLPVRSTLQSPTGTLNLLPKTIPFPSGDVEFSPKEIFDLSKRAVKETRLENIDVALEEDATVKISVKGPLFFDLGSAELGLKTMTFLKKMVAVLQKTPNEVHVVGHTDDTPVRSKHIPSNWELSALRASNVAKFLIKAGKLAPGRFTIVGQSMYRPQMPNISDRNRQMNRRVDIVITPEIYKGI